MKRIFFNLLALCCTLGAAADGVKAGYSSVTLCAQNGETTTITLTDQMTTSFTEKDIVFSDATNEVSLPLARLRSYSFGEAVVPEGISAPMVSLSGEAADVFTLDGRHLTTTRNLSLAGLQPGTYIVRQGGVSIKINHK